jgi:lipopolysaccharide/colanic/teichoic acid biosynthesis glycosyltransferase
VSAGGKRALDVIAASLGLILLSPLMLGLALAVAATLGRPVLFRQMRPGLQGRAFCLLKFRTMRADRDANGGLLGDAQRLTRFGRLLRASSLDELPELINVIRGDMSLVGPRPLLLEYLPLYSAEQARRHQVRPGITGWAQVNGRNAVSWEERFRMDVWYIENQSLWLDLRIIARSIVSVFTARGISHPGEATMPVFRGSCPKTPKP